MTEKPLLGLLECPLHAGWMEFEFHQGDKISDLVTCIKAKWSGEVRMFYGVLTDGGESWAFFGAQQDGDYLALRKSDPIPTKPPEPIKRDIGNFYANYSPTGLFETYRLDSSLWSRLPETNLHLLPPAELTENFSIDLSLRRNYDPPPDKEYDVRLVALVAIVGG